MPPKKKAQSIVIQKIDAITNENLGRKHVKIKIGSSGDDCLYYNTSTLIRIAKDRGQFMQPPYFREPATAELIKEIEDLEGQKIVLTQPRRDPAETFDGPAGVEHALMGFEDLITTLHEPLAKQNMYVCPVCYRKAVRMYLNDAVAQNRISRDAADSVEDPRTVDPLDVLSHLGHDGCIPYVVFGKALDWKKHLKNHHSLTGVSAEDNSVRMKVNSFLAAHNGKLSGRRLYHRMHSTTTKYWHCDAHFNVFRYNRLLDQVITHGADLERCLVNAEEDGENYDEVYASESESDMICSDGEGDDSQSSRSSGSSDEGDDEEDEEEVGECSDDEAKAMALYYIRKSKGKEPTGKKLLGDDDDDEDDDVQDSVLTRHEKRVLDRMDRAAASYHLSTEGAPKNDLDRKVGTMEKYMKKKNGKRSKEDDVSDSSSSESSGSHDESSVDVDGEDDSHSNSSYTTSGVTTSQSQSQLPPAKPLPPPAKNIPIKKLIPPPSVKIATKKMVIDSDDDDVVAEPMSPPPPPPKNTVRGKPKPESQSLNPKKQSKQPISVDGDSDREELPIAKRLKSSTKKVQQPEPQPQQPPPARKMIFDDE